MDIHEVEKVSKLARLALSQDELEQFGSQLTRILGYVQVLDEVEIEGAEPMPHAIDLENVFRDDTRNPSLDRPDALANAPKTDGQFFQVPQILEQKDS